MGLFDKSVQKSLESIKQYANEHPDLMEEAMKEEMKIASYTPRCPTCGCTNIRRISSTEKMGNAMAFGLFGNKRKQQFECLNPQCRYRW